MRIKQLSVFLENKQGRLAAAAEVLAKNGIDISALSLADTAEFGVLRLLVDQPEKASEVLNEAGVFVRVTTVLAVAMEDVPGGAVKILQKLSEAGISVEYMYACVGRVTGRALMVLRADQTERAEETLKAAGYGEINPADIYRI